MYAIKSKAVLRNIMRQHRFLVSGSV